jgi:hypothetical protein
MEYTLNCVEEEQLAAQMVAVMDAHFRRPNSEIKNTILRLASEQVKAAEQVRAQQAPCGDGTASPG